MFRAAAALVLVALHSVHAIAAQPPGSCLGGIVFDSERTQLPVSGLRQGYDGVPDVYLIQSDGSGERRLTVSKVGEFSRTPSVSPDGQRIVFHGKRDGQDAGVYVMACADGHVAQMVSDESALGPVWSPDGKQIAFSTGMGARRSIALVDVDTGTVRRIEGLPSDSSGASWSPDGKHITFVSRGDLTWEVFAVELGTGQVRQLTHTTDARTSSQGPAWSPDGKRIAFDRVVDGNFDIYVMNADGTNIVQLTHDPGVDARPTWSPDGQWIAFHSQRGQPGTANEIYTMNADGSNLRRLTANPYFDRHPRWR